MFKLKERYKYYKKKFTNEITNVKIFNVSNNVIVPTNKYDTLLILIRNI